MSEAPTCRQGLGANDLKACPGGWAHREHESLKITSLQMGKKAQSRGMIGPRSVVELG